MTSEQIICARPTLNLFPHYIKYFVVFNIKYRGKARNLILFKMPIFANENVY